MRTCAYYLNIVFHCFCCFLRKKHRHKQRHKMAVSAGRTSSRNVAAPAADRSAISMASRSDSGIPIFCSNLTSPRTPENCLLAPTSRAASDTRMVPLDSARNSKILRANPGPSVPYGIFRSLRKAKKCTKSRFFAHNFFVSGEELQPLPHCCSPNLSASFGISHIAMRARVWA